MCGACMKDFDDKGCRKVRPRTAKKIRLFCLHDARFATHCGAEKEKLCLRQECLYSSFRRSESKKSRRKSYRGHLDLPPAPVGHRERRHLDRYCTSQDALGELLSRVCVAGTVADILCGGTDDVVASTFRQRGEDVITNDANPR